MNKRKSNLAVVSTLLFALMPRVDKAIKHQMLSLISLALSSMFILMPFAPAVASAGPVSYTVNKTVIDVAGKGSAGNVTAAGDIISYQIYVNNTAGIPLTNVTVNDPMIGIVNNVTNLSEGSNETLYGNYTVAQADIDTNGNGTGFIINNVTVVCDQNATVNNATATVPITNCTIVKTVIGVTGNGNGNVTAAGDVISYQINVNNTAGMNLTNVTVTDPMLGGLLLNVTNLEIGSNETVYGNYTVTREDITNNGNGTGFIINNATVDCDQLGPKNATVKVSIGTAASIEGIVTDVAGRGPGGNVTAAGDIITYQFNVTNEGITDLTNATVNDTLTNLTLQNSSINNDTILNPGEIWTYIGNYTITRADITNNGNDTGFIINNATVNFDQLGPKNATVRVPIDTAASIEGIITDVAGQGPGGNVTAAGDIITYQFNVTNKGITDLTNVTVNDTLTNLTLQNSSINNDTILNPGEIWNYIGNYTVTQADINNNGTLEGNNGTLEGGLVNNATTFETAARELVRSTEASETAGDGVIKNIATFNCDQLGPKNYVVQVPIQQNPHYSISKSVINPDASGDCIVNSPGDEVPYRIVVCNDGNVDLTGILVDDPMISLSGPTGDDDDAGVLNPGESWVYDGIYELTQDDINNGNGDLVNTATVKSNELPEESSDVSQPIEQNADLSIQKSLVGIDETGDFMVNQPGDVINYQIAVANNGDVDLHNVHVTDSLISDLSGPTGDSTDPGVLNPGETWIYKCDYIVTQADIDSNGAGSGFITNTATVSCNEHSSESSNSMVPIMPGSIGNDPNLVSNQPDAAFTTSATSGYAPLTVQFTDTSTGSPTSWSWDFNNDGVADSSEKDPAYTYDTPGTYIAKLTVGNIFGSDSIDTTINVLQLTSSNGGSGGSSHSSGGSIGSAIVAGSSSTSTDTSKIAQPENNAAKIEQSTPTNTEPTPVQTAASTPVKESKKTPGFGIISGVTALLGAIYLYRRR